MWVSRGSLNISRNGNFHSISPHKIVMAVQNKRWEREVLSICWLIENDIYDNWRKRKKANIQIARKAKGALNKTDWWYMLTSTICKISSFDVQMSPYHWWWGWGRRNQRFFFCSPSSMGREILHPNISLPSLKYLSEGRQITRFTLSFQKVQPALLTSVHSSLCKRFISFVIVSFHTEILFLHKRIH